VGIIIAYILPAVMYLRLREPDANTATFYAQGPPRMVHTASGNGLPVEENLAEIGVFDNVTHRHRLPALFLLIISVLLLIACTSKAVFDAVHPQPDRTPWCHL